MLLWNRILTNFFKYKRKLHECWSPDARTQFCTINKGRQLKVLFFGTDSFSLPSLIALHHDARTRHCDGEQELLGVVTSYKSPANCVRSYAEKQQLPLYRWPIHSKLSQNFDLGVVVSFGHLIPEDVIKSFPQGMINVHASLLPRWRGAAPIIYAIMNGDRKTGVSIMRIEPKRFDIGEILAQKEVDIADNALMPELHDNLAREGANLLLEVLRGYPLSFQNAVKQDESKITYAPKITSNITEVSLAEISADELYRRYRGLYGFRYLSTRFGDKNIQLIDIRSPTLLSGSLQKLPTPGSIIYLKNRKCLVAHCKGASQIEVHRLRVEGKKIMNATDFNNGFLKNMTVKPCLFPNKSETV